MDHPDASFTARLEQLSSALNQLQKALDESHQLGKELLGESQERVTKLASELRDGTFKVIITATVKAGKSTFLNALLGAPFLPAGSVPETAVIVRIIHDPTHPAGLLEDGQARIQGVARIREYIAQRNTKARTEQDMSPMTLVLRAPLAMLPGELQGVQVELWDSPGAGEAGWSSLNDGLKETLQKADVVLYLLDGSKLGSALDDQYLEVLVNSVDTVLLKNNNHCLYFLINKFQETTAGDATIGELQGRLSKQLNKLLNAKLGQPLQNGVKTEWIQAERILPMKALFGYLARAALNDTLGEDIYSYIADMKRITPDEVKRYSEEKLAKAKKKLGKIATKDLKRSNVAVVEKQVLMPLLDQRVALFLSTRANQAVAICDDLNTNIVVALATLKKQDSTSKEQLAKLLDEIRASKSKFASVSADLKKDSSDEYRRWLRRKTGDFRIRANSVIDAMRSSSTPTATINLPILGSVYKWFTEIKADLSGASQKDELKKRVAELGEKMSEALMGQLDAFKAELADELFTKQAAYASSLERFIRPFLADLEKRVQNGLQIAVKLPGKSISLRTAEFADLKREFAAAESFLKTSERVESYSETRRVTHYEVTYEKSGCNGTRRVERPVERTVTDRKTRTVQSHNVDMDAFVAKWKSKLGDVIDELERVMLAVIERQLEEMSTQVVKQFQTHHDQYCAIITRETRTLETDIKVVEARQRQLRDLELQVSNAADVFHKVSRSAAKECDETLNQASSPSGPTATANKQAPLQDQDDANLEAGLQSRLDAISKARLATPDV